MCVYTDGASQLFLILKRLFQFKNAIPILEIQTQKRLGTVTTRLYIVEMFQIRHVIWVFPHMATDDMYSCHAISFAWVWRDMMTQLLPC